MTKIIKQRQKGFTIVDNSIIRDDRLSWKARGIFAYLWSQSDEWEFFTGEVVKHSPDGITALRSGLEELEKHGYLVRKRTRNEKGQISNSDWVLSDKQHISQPRTENRYVDNPTLRSTDLKNYQQQEISTKEKAYSPAKAELRVTLADYQNIIDSLNKSAGTNYRATGKKTQRLIHARFTEGFSAADFKTVIDNKVAEWKGTDMAKYLRPETLFGTKFESYLNQATVTKPAKQERFYE